MEGIDKRADLRREHLVSGQLAGDEAAQAVERGQHRFLTLQIDFREGVGHGPDLVALDVAPQACLGTFLAKVGCWHVV